MSFKIFFVGLLSLCTSLICAQNTLEIEVTNLRSNKGYVSLELLNENEENIGGKSVTIKNEKGIILLDNLKEGMYAIRYFHDENANKEIDMNFIGIPKEGIGFSNDAYGMFGPKDFKEWLFEVKGHTKIKLKTTYYF